MIFVATEKAVLGKSFNLIGDMKDVHTEQGMARMSTKGNN